MTKDKLDIQLIRQKLTEALRIGLRYRLVIFIVFVALVYGFIYTRLNSLNNAQPSPSAISAQTNPVATAHVDKAVVSQLEALKDNSVNVQALFEQARNNPFQD